jgi:hypothetical protein
MKPLFLKNVFIRKLNSCMKKDILENAINLLQSISSGIEKPEDPKIVAQRIITKINQNLRHEGKPIISDYDALRAIESDIAKFIEQDRLGRISSEIKPCDDFHSLQDTE